LHHRGAHAEANGANHGCEHVEGFVRRGSCSGEESSSKEIEAPIGSSQFQPAT
jgi:hypothetical protein